MLFRIDDLNVREFRYLCLSVIIHSLEVEILLKIMYVPSTYLLITIEKLKQQKIYKFL